MITGYHNRFDATKNYEEHLFRAGYVLQSAELNEIQTAINTRLKGIGDALFKDGDVVRDAQVVVDSSTGIVRCASGAIYLRGAVRGVPPATFTISTVGVVAIGVYLRTIAVTELDDPELRDPASLTRNYQEPGAGRKKVTAEWGFAGDSQAGDFFPVYEVEDGTLRAKEAPPTLDAFNQALARYDRDSAGGTYVVTGLAVQRLGDLNSGEQVYSVAEGRARVNGYGVEQNTARRVVYDAQPDLRLINSEPHVSTTASAQRVNVDRTPINDISEVTVTLQKTVTLTHGGFVGAADPLPDTSILQIMSVTQGGTTYTQGVDYKLTSGAVDWSLAGAEPATGSTYSVTYRYITNVTPTNIDETGFTVTGAVVGSLVLVTYNQKLPRFDRLVMTADGALTWIKGVAAEWNPQAPVISQDILLLATVYQAWTADGSYVVNDSVRVVPMQDLAAINGRIDYMLGLIAQQRLEGSANLKEAIQKKGLFVDPFLDDTLRDAGAAQTAAIVAGELILPVAVDKVSLMPNDVAVETSLSFTQSAVLSQTARTGSMKINPYMAFDPIPAVAKLTPSVDRWTEFQTSWASSITQRFVVDNRILDAWHLRVFGSGFERYPSTTNTSSSTSLVSQTERQIENLRQIQVSFTLTGFGPNETLTGVTFDGIAVTATAP